MKVLVLGGRGALGAVVSETLRSRGHEAVSAGRSSPGIRIDASTSGGRSALSAQARGFDVVVNASGVEDPRLADAVGGTPLVEISATARYLAALRDRIRITGDTALLGAGLAPGLTTVLAAAVPAVPSDDLDVAIVLGTGEHHGPQAVAWTAGLAGTALYLPPEGTEIRNLRERRRLPSPTGPRTYLRADFPDHLLIGQARGIRIRSYLAVGGPFTTSALGLVGAAPALRSLLARAPHTGDARWSVTVSNRRTGEQASATGDGQSRTTGILTARAVEALVHARTTGAVTVADLAGPADLHVWMPELAVAWSGGR